MRPVVYSNFDELPPGCDSLFEAAGKSSFFHTLPWYRNLVKHGLPGEMKLRIYLADDARGVKGVLPMMHDGSKRTLEAVTNYYASLFTPIVGDSMDEVLGFFAESVARERWPRVDLHPMDVDSPIFEKCAEAFRAAGMIVLPYFCFGNWFLDVGGRSYQEYSDSLPSKLKNTLKRKSKQLHASGEARVEIITRMDGIEDAIAAYEQVYRASWKVIEPFPEFMPELIRTCAGQGWLRLGLVFVGDEPAAAQVWMVKDGVASIYKLAYDERFSKLSAGSILTAALMEHVIDVDKVKEVDYLTGDDDYKKDWMSHRRERWGLSAYNYKTLAGFADGVVQIGKKVVRGFLNEGKHGPPHGFPMGST